MKNLLLTLSLFLVSLISNSQVVKVRVTGLQYYTRPFSENVAPSVQNDKVFYTDFGTGDCEYIFDLDNQKFTMNDKFGNYFFEGQITKVNIGSHIIDVSVGECDFILTNVTDDGKIIFIIEYKHIPTIDGSFAPNEFIEVSY